MKRLIVLTLGVFVFFLPSRSQGMLFSFSGMDAGGIGSVTMNFEGLDSLHWMVTIENTSPTNLEDGSPNANAPGIDGFGFDVDVDFDVDRWDLYNLDADKNRVTLGSSETVSHPWGLDERSGSGSISVDIFLSNGPGGQASLYNPAAIGMVAPETDPFFTAAILDIWFEGSPLLDADNTKDLLVSFQNDPPDGSPFVRMQNVGLDGKGSLKLFSDSGPAPIPEPASMLLLGSGLICLAGIGRKKVFNNNRQR